MNFPKDLPSPDQSGAHPLENFPLKDKIEYSVKKNQFTKPAPKGINAKSIEIADCNSEAYQFNLNHCGHQAQAFRFGHKDENFYRRQSQPSRSLLANLDNKLKLLSKEYCDRKNFRLKSSYQDNIYLLAQSKKGPKLWTRSPLSKF